MDTNEHLEARDPPIIESMFNICQSTNIDSKAEAILQVKRQIFCIHFANYKWLIVLVNPLIYKSLTIHMKIQI